MTSLKFGQTQQDSNLNASRLKRVRRALGLGVLMCVFFSGLYGCGSESSPVSPAAQKTGKRPAGAKPEVVLLLEETPSSAGNLQEIPGRRDLQSVEVIPPKRPGERGVTLGEVSAMRALAEREGSLREIEVIPPTQPGEPGLTQRELNASRAAAEREPSPQEIEVIPPTQPGGRGMTQEEVDSRALASARPEQEDPNLIEVIPPQNGATVGLTQGEVLAKQKTEVNLSNREVIPPKANNNQKRQTGNLN